MSPGRRIDQVSGGYLYYDDVIEGPRPRTTGIGQQLLRDVAALVAAAAVLTALIVMWDVL